MTLSDEHCKGAGVFGVTFLIQKIILSLLKILKLLKDLAHKIHVTLVNGLLKPGPGLS